MEITHPGTCIAHPGRCIVLWGGCVSGFTLQLQGGIDSVKINTPPPWKKEWALLGSLGPWLLFQKLALKVDFFLKTRLSQSRYLQANWFKIIENEEIYKRMSCRVAKTLLP